MKFSTVLFFAIGAVAVPQGASVTSAPVSSAPVATGLTPAVSCALACNAGDVTCQAQCLGNARPNASQAIETNQCAAKCDQGDGSTAASQKYAQCVDSCINSLFPSSQTAFNGAPAAAGPSPASGAASSAASATGSAGGAGTSGTAGSSSRPTGSNSGSSAAPKATGAADKSSAHLAGAGLAGLLAIFAL